ncbi:hypothetical protein H0O02_04520 [Candidatus Micrarchaeota archaeon]|nr:hypothetical protein [Candidatus Micrarchaeota archaeon]
MKGKHRDLDATLVEKIGQVNKSAIGRFLNSIASMIGGVYTLVCLNIICTAMLGFVVTYAVFLVEGFGVALLPALVTTIPIAVIFTSMLNDRFGFFGMKMPRRLLLLAIFFSLPFGILSLPLLHKMSSGRAKNL